MTTLVLSRITTLPKLIPDLAQLKLAIDFKARCYGLVSCRVSDLWRMFDQAIDDGNVEAKNDLAKAADFAEIAKVEAWREWQDAKAVLLARWC